jgi:hypothetical protein
MISQSVVPGIAIPSVIKGLMQKQACGTLICRIDSHEKRITFWHGRVTGASSTLIDDRMGEIIYRKGIISVDDFVEAAGKVNHKTRFGEALVRSGVFNPLNLWDALNLQAGGIVSALCFYQDIHLTFEEITSPPRGESTVQFEIDKLLDKAVVEVEMISLFQKRCEEKPLLEIDPAGESLAKNDFLKDLVSIIQRSNNFHTIINKESRLSAIYTTRALYEMYAKGILKDTLALHNDILSKETLQLMSAVIEDANFMFTELRACAFADAVDSWETTIGFVNETLRRNLGSGVFVRPEEGFLFENITRACVCQENAKQWVTRFLSPNRWLDVVANAIRDILYEAVLQIIFELQNRQANSPNLAQAKAIIDKMRYDGVSS